MSTCTCARKWKAFLLPLPASQPASQPASSASQPAASQRLAGLPALAIVKKQQPQQRGNLLRRSLGPAAGTETSSWRGCRAADLLRQCVFWALYGGLKPRWLCVCRDGSTELSNAGALGARVRAQALLPMEMPSSPGSPSKREG